MENTNRFLRDGRLVMTLEDEYYELGLLMEDDYYEMRDTLPKDVLEAISPLVWAGQEFCLLQPCGVKTKLLGRTFPLEDSQNGKKIPLYDRFKLTDFYHWRPVLTPLDRLYQPANLEGENADGSIVWVGTIYQDTDMGSFPTVPFRFERVSGLPYISESMDEKHTLTWIWWKGQLVCLSNHILMTGEQLAAFFSSPEKTRNPGV